MPIELPAMPGDQQEAWQAVFEIYNGMPQGWVLIGGQAVYLHAVERNAPIVRATTDADFALDIRGYPTMLYDFTALLESIGFESQGESLEGHQHRWIRGKAKIDVLIPRFLGERATKRTGVTGGTTIAAPATQQALDRAETVEVTDWQGCSHEDRQRRVPGTSYHRLPDAGGRRDRRRSPGTVLSAGRALPPVTYARIPQEQPGAFGTGTRGRLRRGAATYLAQLTSLHIRSETSTNT
jgi:hypothetical protein